MKKLVAVTAISAVLVALAAFAGDDPVTQVAYTDTQGCTAILRPKATYAVQCTTDCYVRVQEAATADAGISVGSSTSVKLAADKLYDTPTTSTQRYLCAVRSTASGTMKVFLYREPRE